MLKVTKNGKNRLDIEFSGKLDSNDMKIALNDMINYAEDIEHGRMFYRIQEFDVPTLGAMVVELYRLPEIFKFMKKFERAAILVDKKWLKKAAEIEAVFMPWLAVKTFDLDEHAQAEEWLTN